MKTFLFSVNFTNQLTDFWAVLYYQSDQFRKVRWAGMLHALDKRLESAHRIYWKAWTIEATLENIYIDKTLTFNHISEESLRIWDGFIWLRIRSCNEPASSIFSRRQKLCPYTPEWRTIKNIVPSKGPLIIQLAILPCLNSLCLSHKTRNKAFVLGFCSCTISDCAYISAMSLPAESIIASDQSRTHFV
jgi:hypothetical protein